MCRAPSPSRLPPALVCTVLGLRRGIDTIRGLFHRSLNPCHVPESASDALTPPRTAPQSQPVPALHRARLRPLRCRGVLRLLSVGLFCSHAALRQLRSGVARGAKGSLSSKMTFPMQLGGILRVFWTWKPFPSRMPTSKCSTRGASVFRIHANMSA